MMIKFLFSNFKSRVKTSIELPFISTLEQVVFYLIAKKLFMQDPSLTQPHHLTSFSSLSLFNTNQLIQPTMAIFVQTSSNPSNALMKKTKHY
jgi:hypothetical protein